MTRPRSRVRALLLLARISNLPTVWTNVIAGLAVAGAGYAQAPLLAVALSLFYTGGMFLNDAFDAAHDAAVRPDRPIPAGDVSRGTAFAIGAILLLAGEMLLLATPRPASALLWGAALAAAIVVYDARHKGHASGPFIMGLCRALVYAVAAGATVAVTPMVGIAAAVLGLYVVLLSVVAKRIGPRAAAVVPWLLAGISLVDGVFIALTDPSLLWLMAVAAFALTRALQRVVPGT